MKFSGAEYENMIFELNISKNKKLFNISAVVCFVVCFVVMTIIENDFYFNLILSILVSVGIYFGLRKAIYNSASKINFVKDILEIEQEIYEDKIIEKVVKKNNVFNEGVYYYKDVAFVKQDKFNYYLYLNKNAAIIINKRMMTDCEHFEKILQANNLL